MDCLTKPSFKISPHTTFWEKKERETERVKSDDVSSGPIPLSEYRLHKVRNKMADISSVTGFSSHPTPYVESDVYICASFCASWPLNARQFACDAQSPIHPILIGKLSSKVILLGMTFFFTY